MKTNLDFAKLRNSLDSTQIKKIVEELGAKPAYENERYIIFPTICHNQTGGSNKLYYYKESHMFKCFTQCEGTFDIFTLVQKVFDLKGKDMNVMAAISFCGLNPQEEMTEDFYSVQDDINYLYNLLNVRHKDIEIPSIDKTILNRFVFDEVPLSIWVNEGISYDSMKKYGISYDPIDNCIIIPNYDINNNLISIRGRYLGEDADAKYKPIIWGGNVLSHPSSASLYGINITKNAISRKGSVIVFESEKSVLMMDSYYGDQNNSVATLGKNISMQQIRLLCSLGVNEVILAYDADYRNYNEMAIKRNEYLKIAETLKTYFNVAVLFDESFKQLNYKDSPIDRGREIFEKIMTKKVYI